MKYAIPDASSRVAGEGWTVTVANADDYVPVGDRLAPPFLTLELAGDVDGPAISARVEVRDGVPRVVSMAFSSDVDEGEVRQVHLREVELDALLELFAAFVVKVDQEVRIVYSGASESVRDDTLAVIRRLRSNRLITPAFLKRVARTYKQHEHMLDPSSGRPAPTKAVSETYFVSRRMASLYVRRARDAGLLPERED